MYCEKKQTNGKSNLIQHAVKTNKVERTTCAATKIITLRGQKIINGGIRLMGYKNPPRTRRKRKPNNAKPTWAIQHIKPFPNPNYNQLYAGEIKYIKMAQREDLTIWTCMLKNSEKH